MFRASNSAAGQTHKVFAWFLFGLLISPLLYYWIYSIWLNPSENYYTNDAEFPHFMNSLAIFKNGRYGYIDHPGTPVQVLGTIILGVTYPFIRDVPGGFVSYYLQEPGRFLDVAHALLICLYLAATCFFFWVARARMSWKDVLIAAGFSVLYFAIHPGSLSASTIWNHNSFNFPFGVLLLLFLYRSVTRDATKNEIPTGVLIALGAAAGIMTAVTIYMAGWVIGVVVTVFIYYLLQKHSWQRTLFAAGLTGVSAIGGFFIAVLPIIEKMSHFRNWIVSLLTHQSNYLDVPEDQPRLERLFANFIEFYRILPALFIFLVLLVIFSGILFVLFRRRLPENPGPWAVVIGLAAQSMAILVMFLDRPLQESYFLSIASILPVWALAVYALLQPYFRIADMLGILLAVFALTGMAITSINNINAKRDEVKMLQSSQEMIASTIRQHADATGRSPEELTLMWMYGSYSPCWGLRLGDSKAYDIFTREIEAICPQQYLLSDGLRVAKFGNNSRLENESWDIIFGCTRNMRRLRELQLPVQVQEHPELTWMCGVPIVVTHE